MFTDSEHLAGLPGAALRAARESRGISLRRFAAQLEVSPATLSAIETGKTALSIARLHRAADLLGVPAERILAGRVTPAAPEPSAPADDRGDWRSYPPLGLAPGLEAALHVFVERGFHAASMRDVAAAAGLSVAGLYHHHPSKAAMLVALLDLTMDELDWRMRAAAAEGGTEAERFARMVEALALFHAMQGELAFLGASEMRGLPDGDRQRIRARRAATQHLLDEQAHRAIEAGEIESADPHTACRAIATMCTSLPSWFRLDGPLPAAEVARTYARYALTLLDAD